MPKEKDLKRHIRARMQKTGESYTAARAQVARATVARATVARRVKPDHAATAGMSDDAVRAKTGRDWAQWVRVLDRAKATELEHKAIASYLRDEHDVAPWWAQTVTIGYERIRGLRDKGQRRGGGYDVNKSKTYPVPITDLYAAFSARARRRWLGDVDLRVKKATREKSMRITWPDGLPVEIYFWAKGREKSQVQLQQRGFSDKAHADDARAAWTERLAELGNYLRSR